MKKFLYDFMMSEESWEGFTFESVPEFRERREVNLYDPECLRIETAIRAVWILYRRGKWGLLASLGLPRRLYEEQFLRYDMRHIVSDHGLIYKDGQARGLVAAIPAVGPAATILINLYKEIYAEEIRKELSYEAQSDYL